MNRITYFSFAAVILTGLLIKPASAQNSTGQNTSAQNSDIQTNAPEPSLGSYARALKQARKDQARKQFDNDNLPRQDKLSVVGAQDSAETSDGKTADQQNTPARMADLNSTDKSVKATITPGESQEDRQKVYDQWKSKMSSQQSQVDMLSRELDVQQREYKLRVAEFYSDAGARLRNQGEWDQEDASYKQRLADKQKALDEAKQKLSDMQEDARKAGVPASVRESDQPNQ